MVHVKPFGAFLEFQAELPSFMAAAAAGGSERAALVGLVHRSEVSWDPQVSITDALQVRCGTGRVRRAGWGRAAVNRTQRLLPRGVSRSKRSPTLHCLSTKRLQVGQQVKAKLLHVDAAKGVLLHFSPVSGGACSLLCATAHVSHYPVYRGPVTFRTAA